MKFTQLIIFMNSDTRRIPNVKYRIEGNKRMYYCGWKSFLRKLSIPHLLHVLNICNRHIEIGENRRTEMWYFKLSTKESLTIFGRFKENDVKLG